MDKIQEAMELKNKRILKAINHRDKQIAYFNSVNSAISLVGENLNALKGGGEPENIKKNIVHWRNWFYEQWQEWYIETNELGEEETKERPF